MIKTVIDTEDEAFGLAQIIVSLLSNEKDIPLKTVRRYANALAKWCAIELAAQKSKEVLTCACEVPVRSKVPTERFCCACRKPLA